MIKEILIPAAKTYNIDVDDTMADKFERYAELLVEYNKNINLTSITDPEGIAYRHFLDSIMLFKYVDFKSIDTVADVGTGAGFPGIPLLIMNPSLKVSLIDSTEKKLNVIKEILLKLNLSAETVHLRAEEAGRDPGLREHFDLVTARAVSEMCKLSEYCIPLVKTGGKFVPLKSNSKEELLSSEKAVTKLGGKISETHYYFLPDSSERSIIIIDKIKPTGREYPRSTAQIIKKPL